MPGWGLALAIALALGLSVSAARAAEGIDGRLLPRLQRLIERAESDPEAALEGLRALSQQWRRDPQQQRFVVRECAALLFRLDRQAEARRELEARSRRSLKSVGSYTPVRRRFEVFAHHPGTERARYRIPLIGRS